MKRWLWLIPILAAVAAYAVAPWSALVWDDELVQRQLLGFMNIQDAFHPPRGIPDWTYAYFRPLVILSYLLDSRLFGASAAAGPHAVNVLCHLTATFFVWLLARRLFAHLPNAATGALVTATVFAVHPIHVESVSWIAGRSDVLATLFLLPSLLLALRWRDRGSLAALLLAPMLYFLALLTKETAFAALVLVPLLFVLVPPPVGGQGMAVNARPGVPAARQRPADWPALSHALLKLVGAAGVFLPATWLYFVLRRAADIRDSEMVALTGGEILGRLFGGATYYLSKLFVPWPPSNIVSWAMVPGLAIAIPILLLAAGLTGWGFWLWRRRGDGTLLLAACWIGVTLAVPLWIAVGPANNTPLAERHLYLPSVGMTVGVGLAWCVIAARGWRTPPAATATALAAILIGAYAVATINGSLIWRTDLALWTNASIRARDRGLSWSNLGLSQLRVGNDQAALQSFERALATDLEPAERARAHTLLATILVRMNEIDQAMTHFTVAVRLNPGYAEPHYGLGDIYRARLGQLHEPVETGERDRLFDLAIYSFESAIARNPGYFAARLALASVLTERGQALEIAGNARRSLPLFRAALGQLNAIREGIPAAHREEVVQLFRKEVRVDADELQRQLEAHLARLRSTARNNL